MPPLLAVSVLLWWTLGWRWVTLRSLDVDALVADGDPLVRIDRARTDAERGSRVIASLVAVAPLLGLLGTVTGMIETFDSLGNMVLFARSGGIAGGIAQALVSTQMGLSVAIPGVLAAHVLVMKQRRLESRLDEAEAACAWA